MIPGPGSKVLVSDLINDLDCAFMRDLTVPVLFVNCRCVDLGELHCLVFIIKISMDKDLFAIGSHCFKSHYGSAGKRCAIELKLHDHAAISAIRHKITGRCHFRTIDNDRSAGLLVHKRSRDVVHLARDEVDILQLVEDSNILVSIRGMTSCITVKGSRAAIGEVDRLFLIVDIFVPEDRRPCLKLRIDKLHVLIHHDAPAGQVVSVNNKIDILCAVFLFRSKHPLFDLVAIRVDHPRIEFSRFSAVDGLEHHSSCEYVFVPGQDILIYDPVPDEHITLGHHRAVIRIGICRLCVSCRDMYCLGLIIDILVDDDFPAIVISTLEDYRVFAFQLCPVKHECKGKRPILLVRCKCDHIIRQGDTAGRLFTFAVCSKTCLCKGGGDLLAGTLAHDTPPDRVLRTGDKVLVNKGIDHRHFFIREADLVPGLGIDRCGLPLRDIDSL